MISRIVKFGAGVEWSKKMDRNTFISVRLTSGSIRIFKEVIRMMNNPKFIRLSVNESGKRMAVEPYHRKTFTSFAIPRNLYASNGAMVIYSKPLCSLLYSGLNWNPNKLYRIPGILLKEQETAVFDLTNAVCYDAYSSDKAF